MNSSFDELLGDTLTESILNQDLEALAEELKSDLAERGSDTKKNQVGLYSDETLSLSMLVFEQGGFFRDRTIDNGTAILQILEGKMCFQSGETHVHPRAGEQFYLKPGVPHSLQADTKSTVLLTIIKNQ